MKLRLNLPLAYDRKRGGFYYTSPVEHFPTMAVTEAEIFSLLVAHKAIAQYHGTPFQAPLEAVFRKLTGQLDRSAQFTLSNLEGVLSFRPFAPEDTGLDVFQTIARAVQEHRALRFLYRNLGASRAQRRHVRPYHIACIENHWYLFAWDVDRRAMRTYVLTRLREPVLTGERFTIPQKFNASEYLRDSFSVTVRRYVSAAAAECWTARSRLRGWVARLHAGTPRYRSGFVGMHKRIAYTCTIGRAGHLCSGGTP